MVGGREPSLRLVARVANCLADAGFVHLAADDRFAGLHVYEVSRRKAWTAVSFRTDTTELAAASQAGRPSSGIREWPGVVAVGGGIMIRAKGALVGAIGVSGAPAGDADDTCAKAGIAAIGDAIELE